MTLTEFERSILRMAATHLDDYAQLLNERGDYGVINTAIEVRKIAEKGPHRVA